MTNDNRVASVLRHLESLVGAGTPGDALPPMRELSKTLAASPVTVVRAMSELAARGLVHTEPGRGTFIATQAVRQTADVSWQPVALAPARVDPSSVAALDPGEVESALTPLSHGYLGAELQPRTALQSAASRTVRRSEIWAAAPTAGLTPLRSVFASSITIDPAHVLITPGSQSALSLSFHTLAAPGDAILFENPSYPGAIAAARAAGLKPVPVPTDRYGVRPDYFDEVAERSSARIAYLQTAVNNPTGASLAPERRAEIVAIAERRGLIIIDDDWARNLSLGAPMPAPLIADDINGHVVHLSSLSKGVAPSLRIGFIAARGPALQRLHTATLVSELFVGRPLQEIALEFLSSPDAARHKRALARTLGTRRDHLLATLRAHWPTTELPIVAPSAGYHLWVPCPPGVSSTELTALAHRLGIIVGDGAHYYAEEPAEQRVRMSFSAASETAMTQAVATLAAAVGVA